MTTLGVLDYAYIVRGAVYGRGSRFAMADACRCLASPDTRTDGGGEQSEAGPVDDSNKVAVDVDADSELRAMDSSWSVTTVFRKIFHASPDSRMALKLYGSKKKVMLERKRQESNRSSNLMIHPCSPFR